MFFLKKPSFLEASKEYLENLKNDPCFSSPSDSYSNHSVHAYVTVFGCSVVAGFVFRRYLTFLFTSFVLAILLIKGLECQSILAIDWSVITNTVGFDPTITLEQLFHDIWSIANKNLYVTGTGVIGFLIGYKAG